MQSSIQADITAIHRTLSEIGALPTQTAWRSVLPGSAMQGSGRSVKKPASVNPTPCSSSAASERNCSGKGTSPRNVRSPKQGLRSPDWAVTSTKSLWFPAHGRMKRNLLDDGTFPDRKMTMEKGKWRRQILGTQR